MRVFQYITVLTHLREPTQIPATIWATKIAPLVTGEAEFASARQKDEETPK